MSGCSLSWNTEELKFPDSRELLHVAIFVTHLAIEMGLNMVPWGFTATANFRRASSDDITSEKQLPTKTTGLKERERKKERDVKSSKRSAKKKRAEQRSRSSRRKKDRS